jgi:hypothetical protein
MDGNLYLIMQKPVYQGLVFLFLTIIFLVVSQPKSAETAWVVAAYTFCGFLLINAALIWIADSPWRYFFYSIGVSIAYLACIAVMMQVMLKILQLKGSGESAMAFLILIYQPFALMLVMFAKWIVVKWFYH